MTKLLISGQEAWKLHKESGARFLIRPVTPARYGELRKLAMDGTGRVDFVAFCGLIVHDAIGGWKDVGTAQDELPCDEPNRKAFAANHATTIMPWAIDEATSLDRYRVEELDEAKKD
jgi:hypothetical protein